MICPYCGQEMEVKYLTSGANIFLSPMERKLSFKKFRKGMRLDIRERAFINGANVKIYVCAPCQKCIIDMKEVKERLDSW